MTEDELLVILGIGHVVAVLIIPPTVWVLSVMAQNRKGKREAQMKVFLTLMADRQSDPITKRWVDALNVIDVVFQSSRRVRRAWGAYMDCLDGGPAKLSVSNARMIALLAEMARYLGYRNLKEADIDRYYRPKYFSEQKELREELIEENLRVLKHSKSSSESLTAEEVKKVAGK